MKPQTLTLVMTMAAVSTASAVEFNTDALKTIQQEGHKIAAEAQGGRAFKMGNGFCLDYAGKALVLKKCKKSGSTQTWHFDGQSRLVASDGRCVNNAQLAKCGGGKNQKWTLDQQNRLANANGQCLQPQGNIPKNGAKLSVAKCSGAGHQVWKS